MSAVNVEDKEQDVCSYYNLITHCRLINIQPRPKYEIRASVTALVTVPRQDRPGSIAKYKDFFIAARAMSNGMYRCQLKESADMQELHENGMWFAESSMIRKVREAAGGGSVVM